MSMSLILYIFLVFVVFFIHGDELETNAENSVSVDLIGYVDNDLEDDIFGGAGSLVRVSWIVVSFTTECRHCSNNVGSVETLSQRIINLNYIIVEWLVQRSLGEVDRGDVSVWDYDSKNARTALRITTEHDLCISRCFDYQLSQGILRA
jgi:hypothetical protein